MYLWRGNHPTVWHVPTITLPPVPMSFILMAKHSAVLEEYLEQTVSWGLLTESLWWGRELDPECYLSVRKRWMSRRKTCSQTPHPWNGWTWQFDCKSWPWDRVCFTGAQWPQKLFLLAEAEGCIYPQVIYMTRGNLTLWWLRKLLSLSLLST